MSAEPTPLDERTERVIWEMVDSLGTIDGVAMNDWGEGDPDFLKARDALRNRIRELVEEARLTKGHREFLGRLAEEIELKESTSFWRQDVAVLRRISSEQPR